MQASAPCNNSNPQSDNSSSPITTTPQCDDSSILATFVMLKQIVREELSGWKRWETLWLMASCLVVLGLSIYWQDSLMGIVSATTGIAYTVCNGKGKRVAYIFGMINSLLYAIISFGAGYYGEVMLNGLYYFPMMFVGLFSWNKRMNNQTAEVIKRKMTWRQRIVTAAGCLAGTIAYGFILRYMGDPLPFVDAFTTVTSVVALIVAIKRYMEQWFMWTAVNAVTIIMWAIAFASGGDTIATLVMWVVYLATGIIMYFKWARELRAHDSSIN